MRNIFAKMGGNVVDVAKGSLPTDGDINRSYRLLNHVEKNMKIWACYSGVNSNFLYCDTAIEITLENHRLISRN